MIDDAVHQRWQPDSEAPTRRAMNRAREIARQFERFTGELARETAGGVALYAYGIEGRSLWVSVLNDETETVVLTSESDGCVAYPCDPERLAQAVRFLAGTENPLVNDGPSSHPPGRTRRAAAPSPRGAGEARPREGDGQPSPTA